MSYRNITVEGIAYKWRVGRSNIEIREDVKDNPKHRPAKMILPRPEPQKRWGVITPNLDWDIKEYGYNIKIFFDEDEAIKVFEYRKSLASSFEKEKIELINLPAVTFRITPDWIKQQILNQQLKPSKA
jgi:hypothetical protein